MKLARFKSALIPLVLAITPLFLLLGILLLTVDVGYTAPLPPPIILSPPEARAGYSLPLHGSPKTVRIAGQTTSLPPISNIIGATYDQARGELIVFGIADPALPPLDYDYIRENLVIALRAYYHPVGFDMPGVSIEGTENPLEVIYFGGLADTHFGQVSFESDRLLKAYTMGMDNLTELAVTSNVTGYMSYPDRMQLQNETVPHPIATRYFFTPTLLVGPVTTPHTILFSETQHFVDWAFASSATSEASRAAAQGFVDNFNQYYWHYAAERYAQTGDTTLYEMIQLSKVTAIAQWAYEEGFELKLPGIHYPWLAHYPVASAGTVAQTPAITVTWEQTVSGVPYEFSMRGGVYAIGGIITYPVPAVGHAFAEDAFSARLPPPPPPRIYEVRPLLHRPLGDPGVAQGPCVAYVIPLADNAVLNGDFEDGPGSAPWQQDSYFEMIWPDAPLNGAYGAIFPVYHNARVSIFQPLYIPADATMARLTYWRGVATEETTHPHDFFSSYLADPGGARLLTFETLDDGDADGYWHQVSFDVLAHTGQSVQLWFTATTDAANITNFFLDDVSLDYLDPTAPTVVEVDAPSNAARGETVQVELVFHEPMKPSVPPTVTLALQTAPVSYTLAAETGPGYANGYLVSDPTQWRGVYTFGTQTAEGTYDLNISAAQDLAGNVMHPLPDAHTLAYDATSPQVESTLPASGASEVAFDASIVISFSEAISTNTFAYSVSPNPGGWAETWDAAHEAVTLTHSAFTPGTEYTVAIVEARDLAGNALDGAPVTWSFTSQHTDAPWIQSFFPADGARGMELGASIVISFSEAISTSTFSYLVSPDPGGWVSSWDGTDRVVSLAHHAFAPGTEYMVTIDEAQDLVGNSLSGAPVTWSFATVHKVYLPVILRSP